MALPGISQLSCFSAVNRSLRLQRRSLSSPFLSFRPNKLSVVMSLEERIMDTGSYTEGSSPSYSTDVTTMPIGETENTYPTLEDNNPGNLETVEPLDEQTTFQQKRGAKLHDFCLGIPFGGLVLSGGIIGFILSQNPAVLGSGVLIGGALLFLSTSSLKVWRQGKSSLPFILGQAALSGALFWKNLWSYSLTKKVFPLGITALLSAAMLGFYLYVLIAGGNPPPKKLKSAASTAS